ncbi:MAG: hypothetical protein ACK5CW_09465, partial [Verrucomicrobiota bacterium]
EEEEADPPVREGIGQWVTGKTRLYAFEACLASGLMGVCVRAQPSSEGQAQSTTRRICETSPFL